MADNREKMAAIGRELASLGSRGSALEGLEQDLTAAVSRKNIKKAETLSSGYQTCILCECSTAWHSIYDMQDVELEIASH